MTAHAAVVFTRYMMLAVENRQLLDDRTLGEIFYLITNEITFAFLLVTSFIITFLYPEALLIILDLILTVIELFYIIHYYRLENGVKRWYEIYNRLSKKVVVAVFY